MILERLIMVGLDRRSLDGDDSSGDLAGLMQAVAAPQASIVVLSTCERFEIYGLAAHEWPPDSGRAARLDPAFNITSTRRGTLAVRHLMRVAAGLESRLIGEPHVLGQVRSAATAVRRSRGLGPQLQALFAAAVHCGRRVRCETPLGRAAATYADLAVERLATQLCKSPHPNVAIIGTGSVAVEIGERLRQRGFQRLTIVGRHENRTNALAARLNAQSTGLSEVRSLLHRVDAVIAATSAPHAIVRAADLAGVRGRLCIIDLGMPPNVENPSGVAPMASDFGLDDSAPVARPASTMIAQAEDIVEQEIRHFLHDHKSLMEHAA